MFAELIEGVDVPLKPLGCQSGTIPVDEEPCMTGHFPRFGACAQGNTSGP